MTRPVADAYDRRMDPAADAYELLDAGAGRRLERFGAVVLDRPAPGATAPPRRDPTAWGAADARFERRPGASEGGWASAEAIPERWTIDRRGRLPGASPDTCRAGRPLPRAPRRGALGGDQATAAGRTLGRPAVVLNLFAYTGLATLLLARAGARVAHVDASRPAVAWARRNAALSGLDDRPIRWLVDDAARFVAREVAPRPAVRRRGPRSPDLRPRAGRRHVAAGGGPGAAPRRHPRRSSPDRPPSWPAPPTRRGWPGRPRPARPRGSRPGEPPHRRPRAGRSSQRAARACRPGGPRCSARTGEGDPDDRAGPARGADHEHRQPAPAGRPGPARAGAGVIGAAGSSWTASGRWAARWTSVRDRRGVRLGRARRRRDDRDHRAGWAQRGCPPRGGGRAGRGAPGLRGSTERGRGGRGDAPDRPRAASPRRSRTPRTRSWSSSRTPEKPGNLGAIARSADGAGATALIAATDRGPAADPWNPNAVRASVGTILGLPLAVAPTREVLGVAARARDPHRGRARAGRHARTTRTRPAGSRSPSPSAPRRAASGTTGSRRMSPASACRCSAGRTRSTSRPRPPCSSTRRAASATRPSGEATDAAR